MEKMEPWEGDWYTGESNSYSCCREFVQSIPENFDWTAQKVKDSLTECLRSECGTEEIEIVAIMENKADEQFLDISCLYRKPASDGAFVYEWAGDMLINYLNEIVEVELFYGTYESCAQALEDEDGALIATYVDDLITEYKQMNSFADITSEQLNYIIEEAVKRSKNKYSRNWKVDEIKAVNPCYISFGNAAIEGEHLKENAIWLNTMVDLYGLNTGEWTEYISFDFNKISIDVEANRVMWDSIDEGAQYADFNELLVATQLTGTPEENRWVTELLPYDMAIELVDKYDYYIFEMTVDMEGHQ